MSKQEVSADWLHLTEGESVLWAGHPSSYTVGTYVTAGVALVFVGYALTFVGEIPPDLWWVPYVPMALGVLVAGYGYLLRRSVWYVVTDEEIYKKTGLLSRHVTKFRVSEVRNVAIQQSFWERIGGRGTVTIDTSTDGVVTFDQVSDPNDVSGLLTRALDEA